MYKKSNKLGELSSNKNICQRQLLREDFWNGKIPSNTLNVVVTKLVNYESVVKAQGIRKGRISNMVSLMVLKKSLDPAENASFSLMSMMK